MTNAQPPAAPPPSEPAAPPTPPPYPPPPPAPLSDSEARTWAMLAHLSVLLNLVTGFLGILAPLVIYLIYKERSRFVAVQAMQAFVFQLVWWGGGWLLSGILWTITGGLAATVIGLICTPITIILAILAMLLPLAAVIYGVYGGIEANAGRDFKYWLTGDWVNQRV